MTWNIVSKQADHTVIDIIFSMALQTERKAKSMAS